MVPAAAPGRVVVTGGAGFIGAHLCRELAGRGVTDVVVLDDLSTGSKDNLELAPDARLVEGSILDDGALAAAFAGATTVVHLAARPSVARSLVDPLTSLDVNATGTARVLEATRRHGIEHVVVASSSSVYGGNRTLPQHEELAPAPLSPYAASKLATESYALAWAHVWGVPTVAFRFFNVFGPLQTSGQGYAYAVPAFIEAALRGESLTVHGDGEQTRDFTYVGSVCDLLAEAVERRVADPRPVNLAFGTNTSILGLISELEAVFDQPLVRNHVDARPGDMRDTRADTRRLRSLFPTAQPVALADGLQATVDWYRARAGS